MIYSEILNSIENGRNGKNEGIPMGLPRFSEVIPNIQKARYHLVVGESGSGKSAFVDTAYVFNPLEWYVKNKDNIGPTIYLNILSLFLTPITYR